MGRKTENYDQCFSFVKFRDLNSREQTVDRGRNLSGEKEGRGGGGQ